MTVEELFDELRKYDGQLPVRCAFETASGLGYEADVDAGVYLGVRAESITNEKIEVVLIDCGLLP